MNILILHDEKDSELSLAVIRILKKRFIDVKSKSIESDWYKKGSFLEVLADYSHFIIINGPNSESAWENFCIGFAFGKKSPVIMLNRLPSYIHEKSSGDFKFCQTKKDFTDFLNNDFKDWIVKDIRQQAKIDLLTMGIPYNEESFEHCVREENTWAAELFLKAGFLPDATDKHGVPLLNLASRTGNRNMVKILLEGGAEIDRQSQDRGSSALIDACTGKSIDIVKDLIAAGADVNLKSKDGQSGLVIAVGLNDAETVEELLKAGANPDDPDALGASARTYAKLFNKPTMVTLFNTYAPQQ